MPLSSGSTSSTKSIRRAPSELERSDSVTVSFRMWFEPADLMRADAVTHDGLDG